MANNKTLAICGESWFSSDLIYPHESFGEILSGRHNLNLLSLARGGCSNFSIALQVDQAIQMNPDFIIVGCADPDRIEIPIQENNPWENIKKYFNWKNWRKNQNIFYDKLKVLSNIKYSGHNSLSVLHKWLKNPTILSESMDNLAFDVSNSKLHKHGLTEQQIESLKSYMVYLYDTGVKQQYDCWIMSDAVRRLYKSKIPFLIYIEPLFNHELIVDADWINSENKIMFNEFSVYNLPQGARVFHTTTEGAIIFADYVEKRLKEMNFL
jgi:hypothetical protein